MIRDLYQKIYEKQAVFYRKRPTARLILAVLNHALTAIVTLAYALLCLFVLVINGENRLDSDVIRVLCIPALCLFAATALRYAVNRPRPYETGGIFPVLEKKKHGQSFPSRHVACAFVIATVLLRYYPWAGWCVYALGLSLAYIRFAGGLHYPSDLLAGAVLGVLFGSMAFI